VVLTGGSDAGNLSGSLEALCESLDSSVDWEQLNPEDLSTYNGIFRQLEKLVAPLQELPKLPPASNAARIATFQWSKHHQDRVDLAYLLRHLQDSLAIVRFSAADTLSEILKRKGGGSSAFKSPSSALEIHRILEDQLRKETSAVVTQRLQYLAKQSRQAAPRRNILAKIQRNPYVAGLPIRQADDFYGRRGTLDNIQNALATGTGIILYGARRTGKTSLLYRIRDGALGDAWLSVYLDMQAIAGASLRNFLYFVAKGIEETLWEQGLMAENTLPQQEGEADFGFLRQFLTRAASLLEPVRLLLLIDEFEVLKDFFREKNAARQLKSILEAANCLQLILAGSQKIEDLDEKNLLFLLEISRYITISFLTPDETRLLITKPAASALRFSPEAVERIRALTAGHPYYTQILCHTVFDLKKGSGTVQIEDIEVAARSFVNNPTPHLVLTWKTLSLSQKAVCSSLAVLESESSPWAAPEDAVKHLKKQQILRLEMQEARDAMSALRQLDWLQKKEGEARFGFTMELVRRWVAEKRSISDLIEEYRREAYSRPPTAQARTASWSLDLLLLAGVWAFTLFVPALSMSWSEPLILGPPVLLFAAYFLVALQLESATPGMLLRRLRFVTGEGLPLRLGRKTLVASFLWGRSVLWLTAVFHLVAHGVEVTSLVTGVLLMVFEGINGLSSYYDKRCRSLINKLTNTLLVLNPSERKS
jgi:hypothetical protein